MRLKVVLVGCGKIADGHIEEIQKMPEKAAVVAVCDREILMAEQLAMRYRITNYYDNYEQMLLQEKPDVVHITTPPQSHLSIARTAIDAGCHVYVEKPLTLSYADSQNLIQHAENNNKKLTIGYSYYFDPPALKMRELIANGIIGDVLHIESFFGYNLSGTFGSALMGDSSHWVHQLPGKLFHNNIDHVLYKGTEFITDESPQVFAAHSRLYQKTFGDSRDKLTDELRIFMKGNNISFYGTFSSNIKPVGHFSRIYGTKNTIHVDYISRTAVLDSWAKYPSAIGRLIPAFQQAKQYFKAGMENIKKFKRYEFHYFSGMNYLIGKFYDCIVNDSPPPIEYSQILQVSKIMDEIFRQLKQDYKT